MAEEYAQDVDGAWDEKSRVVAAYIKIENDEDGQIIDSPYRGREYVVFKPESVKSATGNNGDFDPVNPDIRFSRANDGGRTTVFEPLANQSTARALNDTLVRYGLGQDWSRAYEAVKLPDALSGVRQALQAAFGRDVRAVAPTAAKFNIFNCVYIPSQPNAVYVNVAADVGFVNIAGHELWHAIKRQRPDLIKWYQQHSRQFYKDLPAYRDRLNALVQEGEKKYSTAKAEEELEADFMGDSLADPVFLQQLADASPSKFRALLNHVRLWLAKVADKLKDLESSKEIADVKALQAYLKEVLVAYADGKEIPAAPLGIASKVSPAAGDQTQTPAFKSWFGDSQVVDAQGKPLVVYHGTKSDISVFDRSRIGSATDEGFLGDGFYFADSARAASGYAKSEGGSVVPAYLSIKVPYYADGLLPDYMTAESLQQSGYDGVIYRTEPGSSEYSEFVAFNPAQIKSATGNNGDFDAGNPDIRFRSADSTLPANPLALDRVNQLVNEALAGIRGAPPVEVVVRPADVGLQVPAGSVGYGVTVRSGDIYVFQSAMRSDMDVFRTVFHELFHRGVRVLVPKGQYVQTILNLAKGDSRIQQLAVDWKNTAMGQKQKENLRLQGYTGSELTAQYEALADVSEEIKAEGKLGSKPKSMTVRFLANWLAKVADLAGMKKLAQGIRAMTYNEAERFVMSAIDRAQARR